ncbi:MAG: hypothetical protein IJY74_05260 [Oscillospiraceae bacterium]|nr:hypothetical protein [Oscillospiraceae bacterium]
MSKNHGYNARDQYGRRKIQPKIRFRMRNILIIFAVCVAVGLLYYMIKVNL